MIPSEVIEQVKAATNIVEVISSFVKLKKHGSDHDGLCPFHQEKTPSFKVHPGKGIYKCFGCGKSGDTISFLIEYEKLDYIGAIKWLGKKYNISIEETNREYSKPIPRLEKLSKEMIEHFEQKRGISNNTLLRFKIIDSNEWMPGAQKEIPVICFNYYRNDELVNVKFRGKNKDFKLEKNAELIFYNIDAIKDEKEVIIVEGEIDCLTMHECGIYNSVSVPNGAARGKQNLQYLDNCWQYFEGKEKIVIAVDNDEPGELLKEELGRRLDKERCFTVVYPTGCKDVNDVLVNYGKEAVLNLVKEAKQWPIEGIILVEDLYKEVVDFYVDGYPEGAKAHISGFDDLLSFVVGQMTMVTGIPGCFTKDQLVVTDNGNKRISNLMVGDNVLSYCLEHNKNEFRKVTNTFKYHTSESIFRIKLKNGTIIEVTENHLFFTGIKFEKIKDILLSSHKLSTNGNLENNTGLPEL